MSFSWWVELGRDSLEAFVENALRLSLTRSHIHKRIQVVSHCWSTGPIGVKVFFKRGQQEVVWWQIEFWFQRKQCVPSILLKTVDGITPTICRILARRQACRDNENCVGWRRWHGAVDPGKPHTLPHRLTSLSSDSSSSSMAAPRRTQGEGGQGSRHDSPPRRPLILTTDWRTYKQKCFWNARLYVIE